MPKRKIHRIKYGPRRNLIKVKKRDNLKLVLRFYVNGLSHHQYHEYADQIVPGTELFLIPHKDNVHDSHAIGVHAGPERDSPQIGWVPRNQGENKALLFNILEAGVEVRSKVIAVYKCTSSIVAGAWMRSDKKRG